MSSSAATGCEPAGGFEPPWWLQNHHVQSIYPSLPLRRRRAEQQAAELRRCTREVVVDCGEGVRLLALESSQESAGRPSAGRVAILLHGWEGSANSLYLLSLGQHLFDAGYDVVRLNLRDHGDSHALNPELFHSCRIAEVVGAVQAIQRRHAGKRLSLAGFSLGGNFSLRVGARAAAAGIDIARIVAVSPVLDPEHTLARLESGWVLYRAYFILKWKRSLRKKRAAWPELYHSLDDILQLDNLTDMTDRLACAYGGFASLPDYLRGYALVGDALEPLAGLRDLRAHIIAAADDPIIPAVDLGRIARPPQLEVTCVRHGGHCGFYEGGAGPTWLEREIFASLERP